MIPPEAPMNEGGDFELVRYEKAPPEMDRRGDEVENDPLDGFEAIEGRPSLSITKPQGFKPGEDIWLRVKGRVKGSQSGDGQKLELELSDVRVEESPED